MRNLKNYHPTGLFTTTAFLFCIIFTGQLYAVDASRNTISSISSTLTPKTSGDFYGEALDYLKSGTDASNYKPIINYRSKTDGYVLFVPSSGSATSMTLTINLSAKCRVAFITLLSVINHGTDSWKGIKNISVKYKFNSSDNWTDVNNLSISGTASSNPWSGTVTLNPDNFNAQYLQVTFTTNVGAGLSGIRVWGYPYKTLTINNNNDTTETKENYVSATNWIKDPIKPGYTFTGWSGTGISYLTRVQNFECANSTEVSFNGTSKYVNLGRDFMFTDEITINLWAYMDNWSEFTTSNMRLYSCTESGGWNIEPNSNGYVNFACYDSGVGYKNATSTTTFASLTTGWHLFTLVFDGTKVKGYIDNSLKATGSDFTSRKIGYNASNAVFIGAEAGTSPTTPAGNYFKGKIKNFGICNGAFSADQISNYLWSKPNETRYYYKEDATINANYTANKYTVTYDSKGGSNIDPQDYEVTTNLTLASSPTKYGYTFAGWKVSATEGNWTADTVYTASQNVGTGKYGFVTLQAQWTANSHTVSVNPNGGVYNSSSSVTTHTGSYGGTQAIADATRTGYRFGGWLWTKEAYDATWAEVFYHYSNGYANLFSSSDNLASNSVNDVNKLSLLNILDKLKYDDSKYEFLLEYYSFTGYNRWTQTSNPATSDVSTVTGYNAVNISWTAEGWGGLAISNQSNTFIDGSVNPATNWFYAIGSYNYWNNGIPACSSTDPEKVNSHLWVRTSSDLSNIGTRLSAALSSDALTSDNKYIYRNEDITIKAVWMPNHYTITYNGNGATGGSTASSSHIYDVAKALTTNGFTYGDYTFVGWSTSAGGDVLYTDGQSVSNLTPTHGGTVTLYAKWATGYRLHSGTGTTPECYSNALSYTGYFSLYHKQGDALTMQIKDEHNNWINLPGNIDCSITNTVIKVKFTYATKVLGTISEYTGDFFVRTNPADGGLDRYPEPYMDNKMSLLTGTAKYYWAKYAYPTTEMKTIVGNLYNPNISATLCDGQILNDTSAMRVNYNRTTNEIKMYQAKDKIASIGANNATIDSLMKCTFVLPSFADDVITSTANVTGMQALSTAFSNTSLTGKRTRIVYDFATDSVFFSRLISSDETGDIDIANSNLVIEATDATTPTVFNTFDIANGRVVYERTFSNNKIWYWISLPYSVKISDVIGMPHYGTAWIVKYYNTQKRANLTGNLATYWEYLPETATLNANEGYLLGFENNYPMPTTLQFPSALCQSETTFNSTTSVTLPNYTGQHADAPFDANWHLVGSPLYSTSKVSGPEYIVTINATNTGYFYDRSSATTDLAPFTSFFVQYSGEENFTKPASAPSPAPLLQPKAMGDEEYYELVMTSPTYSEKTGIIMANDGSLNLYEQNKDLLMMGSWGKKYPQLYTCGASNKKMAFNHIAKATQTTLRVGIYIGQAEAYTFSLSNKEVPAISVILRDKLLGIDTDLLHNDYTFNANTGYDNSRFELIINRKADGTTGVLNTTDYAVQFTQNNGKLTISGVESGTEIRLFDMAGRCLHQSKAQETTTLQSLPSGIYTAVVGTEAHKIVVK